MQKIEETMRERRGDQEGMGRKRVEKVQKFLEEADIPRNSNKRD